MITIKIEGSGAALVSSLVGRSLRKQGLKVNRWINVQPTKKDLAECRQAARKESADVLVLAMAGR